MTAFTHDFEDDPVFDAQDENFWAPGNWPGLRAPCRWKIGKYGVHVTLWVRLEDGDDDLLVYGIGSVDMSVEHQFKSLREATAALEKERDDLLYRIAAAAFEPTGANP